MSDAKMADIFENFKQISKQFKIEIVVPTLKEKFYQDMIGASTLLLHENMNKVLTIHHTPPAQTGPIMTVLKNRNHCAMTEFIANQDCAGLENYLKLMNDKTLLPTELAKYPNRFFNNFVYILTKININQQQFINILDSSVLFNRCELNNNDFWIKVAFKADNYQFLMEKLSFNKLINVENLQELVSESGNDMLLPSRNNILKQLLQEEDFIVKMNNDFNLLKFLPTTMFYNHNALELLLKKINIKKKIDFNDIYTQYTQYKNIEKIDKTSYEFECFNQTMKVFILESNYQFSVKDESLESLNAENQQIIVKKRLNYNLKQSLTPKTIVKRSKI